MKVLNFFQRWAASRFIRDPEKLAQKLGRPARLELTDVQARMVEAFYVDERKDAADVAKAFFKHWSRTDFDYFRALNDTGTALVHTTADYALDGVELIEAAMRALGAMVQHEGDPDWYLQTAHPMAKRLAESAQENFEASKKQRRGLADAIGAN